MAMVGRLTTIAPMSSRCAAGVGLRGRCTNYPRYRWVWRAGDERLLSWRSGATRAARVLAESKEAHPLPQRKEK